MSDLDRSEPHRFARLDSQPHDPVRVVARRAAPHGRRVVAERPQRVGRLVDGAVREPPDLGVGEIVALGVSAEREIAADVVGHRPIDAVDLDAYPIRRRRGAAPGQGEQRADDAAHAGYAGRGALATRHSGDASQVAGRDVMTDGSRAALRPFTVASVANSKRETPLWTPFGSNRLS